jgi:uncharacterized protein (TIGR04222 family)
MLEKQVDSNAGSSTRNGLLGILAVVAIALTITELFLHLIANMPGPLFLLFYGIVIAITLFVIWQLVQAEDNPTQPLPPIPAEPDPYKIAYLKSAAKGVAEVAVINLIQKNYLQVHDKKITVNTNHPQNNQLSPLEQAAYVYFAAYPRSTVSIESIAEKVQPHSLNYQQQLLDEQLLTTDESAFKKISLGLPGFWIIIGLGGFKLVVALMKGHHNVGFLIIMALVSLIILWYICTSTNNWNNVSNQGIAYLRQIQQAFYSLQQKIKTENTSELEYSLAVALFGLNVLAGTIYAEYQPIFYPVTTTTRTYSHSSGGCSSGTGCGSTSSCGSSCGGGSGCGGCGGCGGGCGG